MSHIHGGWPKKDADLVIYQDTDKSYILVDKSDSMRCPDGSFTAISNVYSGSSPSLCTSSVSPGYIAANWLKRVEWSDLSEDWKKAFLRYLEEKPEEIRGFWRVRNPAYVPKKGV